MIKGDKRVSRSDEADCEDGSEGKLVMSNQGRNIVLLAAGLNNLKGEDCKLC